MDKITIERETLLPCPFCGDDGDKGRQEVTQMIEGRNKFTRITCRACGAMCPEENWNRRAALAAQPAPAAVPPGYALVPLEPTHDILCALTQEWHTSRHDAMTECPNCVTPWKCNGPHMTDDIPLPTEEIAAYWDIAYSEGDRNARYDTSDGSAQSALQDLQEAIRAYGDARAAAATERAAQVCDEHASIEGIAQKCAAAIRAAGSGSR